MRVRSTWRRKAWPRPAPWLAPSMRPGTSAIVGRRSSSPLEVEHAEVRLERRERVVGDLGRRRGERGEQGGLARVREADEPDVGDEPQLEAQPALLAGLAALGVLGRLVGGGLEVGVAEAAPAAAGDLSASCPASTRSATSSPVASSKIAVPGGTVRTRSSPARPCLRDPDPRPPAVGPEVMGVAEVAQGRLAGVDLQADRAAAAAVAAVRAAARDVGLPPERRGTVAAVAGMDPDLHAVKEHRAILAWCRERAGGPSARRAAVTRRSEVGERVHPV